MIWSTNIVRWITRVRRFRATAGRLYRIIMSRQTSAIKRATLAPSSDYTSRPWKTIENCNNEIIRNDARDLRTQHVNPCTAIKAFPPPPEFNEHFHPKLHRYLNYLWRHGSRLYRVTFFFFHSQKPHIVIRDCSNVWLICVLPTKTIRSMPKKVVSFSLHVIIHVHSWAADCSVNNYYNRLHRIVANR